MSEVPVILKKLPHRIRGFACLGSDLEPIIIINEDLSPYEQKKVYHHEMGHIERGEIWDMKFSEYGEVRE
jgi:Zn-dependent peptidase ImmA (M78 family)